MDKFLIKETLNSPFSLFNLVAEMKYVLVTGGVVSGLGKGVTASSIGLILKACGLRVTSIKIGPFLLSLSFFSVFHSHIIVSSSIHLCNARRNTKEKHPTIQRL